MPKSAKKNSLVLSYLGLRKAIGIIGISLPFVLAIGKIILEGPGIQDSISSYYHTVMRDVFVGGLCALAVFFFSYYGYDFVDNVASKLASIFALGTALFPTGYGPSEYPYEMLFDKLHAIFAISLFLTLAFFALVLFRKTNPTKRPTPQKRKRNIIYTISGVGILACIGIGAVIKFLPPDSWVHDMRPIFWLEALAIVLFGISWFVKGEAILKDEVDK